MRGLVFLLCLLPLTGVRACVAPQTSAALLARVQALLLQAAPGAATRVEAEPIGALPAAGDAVLTLETPWPAGRAALRMQWTDCASGAAQSRVVWFRTRAFRTVWVYGRVGRPETPLADAAPVQAEIDVAPWHLHADDAAQVPAGMFLARAVAAGAPLRRDDLKPAPLVMRDEDVTVEVQGNGVLLRTHGRALQYGGIGDRIAVQVVNADKSTEAQVVARGVVHVDI